MKNLLLFVFGILSLSSGTAQTESEIKIRKDVIDYYWEMASSDTDLIHYPLELKDKKWLTVSNADFELEAEVDYRKGFIFIRDTGIYGEDKSDNFQFVLYERKKNDPLIAISKKKFVDGKWMTEIGFWEKRGGLWTNIASEVLPKLSYQDFLEGGRERNKLEAAVVPLLPIYFNLPKSGNKIELFLLSESLAAYCMTENPDDKHCAIRERIKYQASELHWNRGKSSFTLGKFLK